MSSLAITSRTGLNAGFAITRSRSSATSSAAIAFSPAPGKRKLGVGEREIVFRFRPQQALARFAGAALGRADAPFECRELRRQALEQRLGPVHPNGEFGAARRQFVAQCRDTLLEAADVGRHPFRVAGRNAGPAADG